MFRHSVVVYAFYMFPNVLSGRNQHGGHQERQSCESVMQLEDPIIDSVRLRFELEVLSDAFKRFQHLSSLPEDKKL